jgi:hypothetical protein
MHLDFSIPSPSGIKGRSSTIAAAFVQGIVPAIKPPDKEVDDALAVVGMRGAYCGDSTTEQDHFRPLVPAFLVGI